MECDVRCSRCGEAIIGCVNRCWRCGQTLPAISICWPFPPVRRSEMDSSQALLADVIEFSDAPLMTRAGMPLARCPSSGRLSGLFADVGARVVGSSASRALAAACASNVLGLLSILVSLEFPRIAAAIAGLGIAAGCIGLRARRPETAISGLALSCAALLLSGIFLTVAAYVHLNGMNPWDPFVAQPYGP